MAEKGWIKLHRQLQECPMWYAERFSKGQAWVDLLLLANHSDKKILFNGEIITIQRGQYLTSMVKLAEKWKWSRPTVVKFLNLLERDRMITRSSDNTKTLITIENYSVYQDIGDDDLQPSLQPSLQPTLQDNCNPVDNSINNPLYTNKNDKNDKNVKNDKNDKNVKNNIGDFYPDNEELNLAFKEFVTMRNKIKKPLATKQAITRMINKLEKLSYGDDDLAIKILHQSTDHCWQDVYELKTTNSYTDKNYGGTSNGCTIGNDADKTVDEVEEAYYRAFFGK